MFYKRGDVTFFSRNPKADGGEIREALERGRVVRVVNLHESFYGHDFGDKLREELRGVPCKVREGACLSWKGFPQDYLITPVIKKDIV